MNRRNSAGPSKDGVENALAGLDRDYEPTPAGLGVTVAWGIPYFRRYVAKPAKHYLPHDLRAKKPALLEARRFPSDPAETKLEQNDVAVLLREVEAWVERESALALRYELDGRAYILEAGEPDWSADVAAAAHADRANRRARLLQALSSIDRALSAYRSPGREAAIRGLEDLRQDITLALRVDGESP